MRSLYPWPLFPPHLDPPAARSLSLQLALQEWLDSCYVILPLQQKMGEIGATENPMQEIEEISLQLQKFLLFSLENPFSKKPGTLDKLCFYCEELLRASNVLEREEIGTLLDHMRDAALCFRALTLSWKRKMPPSFILLTNMEHLHSVLMQRLREFYDALYPFFAEAKSDENVLFFLIEHKAEFNRFLHPKKIETLLSRLYPSGPTHLRAILCEGYTRRGFSDFYLQHESLIESIEWTADECKTTSITR
jgi:hypothetical protein